jgi:NTE family protein
MGAYVGSLWCAGYDGRQLEALAAEMKTRKHFLQLADPVFPPRQGFLRGRKVKEHLLRSLGSRTFESLEKELFVVATNLTTLERKVFTEGDIATAVHASIAIPGVCVPVEIDGAYYSDGGICDPLPVGVLRNAGVDRIIAVSTLPGPEELVDCRVGRVVNREVNIFAKGNMIDILRSAAYGSQIRLANHVGRQADVLLRAVLCEGRWHDYANYEKYIRLGRELAEAQLDEITEVVRPRAAA